MRRPALLLLPILLLATPAAAQRQNQYDAQGRYTGHTERTGDRVTRYDTQGRITGYSEHSGDTTVSASRRSRARIQAMTRAITASTGKTQEPRRRGTWRARERLS